MNDGLECKARCEICGGEYNREDLLSGVCDCCITRAVRNPAKIARYINEMGERPCLASWLIHEHEKEEQRYNEVRDAAAVIKNYCNENICGECPFFIEDHCLFNKVPNSWEV